MKNNTSVESSYFTWLLEHCGIPYDYGLDGYSKVLKLLYETEFYAVDDLDDNRIEDGLTLRDTYMDMFELRTTDCEILETQPVSCLEVLIAMAERFESEIAYDYNLGDRTLYWLISMMDNLHIFVRNKNYISMERFIVHQIYGWMDRTIERDRLICPFFIDGISAEEARETQLWELAQRYYVENREAFSTIEEEDGVEIWSGM